MQNDDAPPSRERLIRLLVVAPDKIALESHKFELIGIHFGYELGPPLLLDSARISPKNRFRECPAWLDQKQRLMQIVHRRNPYSALLGCGPASYSHFMVKPKKTAIITESSEGLGVCNRVPTKEDFDWLYCEMTGFMRTQILAVAASLQLAEHLQDGGCTAADFATATGIERSMAFRFLRACTQIGLITCDDSRTFKSTSRLQALHGETLNSMRNKAMVLATRAQYLIWSEFLAAVRTNQAQAASALGASIFDYYADHPDEAAIFRASMQDVSEGVANKIAGMLDTSTYSVAVDVGGADGALVHSLMRHNPHLRGIVLDRPEVAAAAATAAKARGLADRTEAIGGDFFKSVPKGDLYLLRFILHDWDDGDAIRILENCWRSMKPGARLVVIEAFFAEPGEEIPVNMIDTQVPLFDLHLMLAVNSKERSLAEYNCLFDKVGLRAIKTTPLDNGYVAIETAVA
jgi:predicted O-methyltransferase YrrM